MCNFNDKEKKSDRVIEVKQTTSDQTVTPIYDGHTQPECTFLQYVENLAKDQPNNWSNIKNDN